MPSIQQDQTFKQKLASFLALFTSTGTLLCCALPSAIAAIAGGAAVTSFISTFPWLVPLSRQKEWIFLASGLMIVLSGLLIYRPKGHLACTITGGQGCEIEELLSLRVDPDTDCGAVKQRAEAKLADVEAKLRDLERIRIALARLATACSGQGPTSDCPILEAMQYEDAFSKATA